MLSQAELHQRFEYRDGELFYKISPLPKIRVGSKAGSLNTDGYIKISINSKKYCAHRIIFAMQHGYMPEFIDHINGNRSDNRIENLRSCTKQENSRNTLARTGNKAGIKNVSWKESLNKWQVDITANGKKRYIGVFEDLELAELVAMEARNKYHGNFANYGIGA
jgi:HNH endonuclease